MTNTDIDRILTSESMVTPSPGFTWSVMQVVRAVCRHVPVVAFPWRRLAAGAAVSVALAALTVGGLALTSGASGPGFDASAVAARLSTAATAHFAVAGTATILALVSTRLLFDFMTE